MFKNHNQSLTVFPGAVCVGARLEEAVVFLLLLPGNWESDTGGGKQGS